MKYKVKLNGKIYEVEVEKGNAELLSEYDAISAPAAAPAAPAATPAPAAAAAPAPAASGNATPSPLPGVVVAVKKNVGDKVKAGEVVMLIEAMKMENEITATKDGTLVAVLAPKGTQVQVGTALFEIA
ncbi:MAG TPA: acetyl-CoA carboxylase biotin carboxyl carrier protein subunit [Clostridiales bacterium]|nr:acetyl-CoA carboxylase biotin carboxyl carrier protein subunit [Clostridiales bacterium]